MSARLLQDDSLPQVRFKEHLLSRRQVTILLLIAEGLSNADIAKMLYLSKRTVETYINRIKQTVAKVKGYRIADRELVLFAVDLMQGLKQFQSPIIIEDWD